MQMTHSGFARTNNAHFHHFQGARVTPFGHPVAVPHLLAAGAFSSLIRSISISDGPQLAISFETRGRRILDDLGLGHPRLRHLGHRHLG